ncbi:MAG: hypothetical protein ACYSWW_19890, partial [Planctomycetota bacterium]
MKLMKTSFRNGILTSLLCLGLILSVSGSAAAGAPALRNNKKIRYLLDYDFEPLRLAISDLIETFGPEYPKGSEYVRRLESLRTARETAMNSFAEGDDSARANLLRLKRDLDRLLYDALLSNPLLDFDELILLKRKRGQLGLPVNHKCNTGIERPGYDNEIAVLGPIRPNGILRTLYRPPAG